MPAKAATNVPNWRKSQNATSKRKYYEKKAKGICVQHGCTGKPQKGMVRCKFHMLYQHAANKKWLRNKLVYKLTSSQP